MRRIALLLGLAAVALTGCMQKYRETALYEQSGRQKAIVTVLPVIDRSAQTHLEWDVAHEITTEIRRRMFDSSRVYLLREKGSRAMAEALATPSPAHLIKPDLGATEFIVISEFLEQKQEAFGGSSTRGEAGAVLSLALRLRILDVRGETPTVVLQEVIDHEQIVARPYVQTDYQKAPWGTEAFERTPIGMAHNHLVRECVSRIEGYIEASR